MWRVTSPHFKIELATRAHSYRHSAVHWRHTPA